jgi:uncharacterized protein YbjT (DUF2867 family)
MMQETVLITGATGTVGREVIKQLSIVDGLRVRAGVHSIIKGENLKRLPNVEVVEMEFTVPESLQAAFTHADRVFLVTPFIDNQVEMAKALVDEAKRANVKHIVKLSVIGAEDEPGLRLANWHREIEHYIIQSGIPYTFLRPNGFMQNFVNYNSKSIVEQNVIYMPIGTGKVSYIDARDIAAVGVEVLQGEGHEGKAYDLTGSEALSMQEVAQTMSKILNRQISFVDVPEVEARNAMQQENVSPWMIDAIMELNNAYKAGEGSSVTHTVEELIGRKPHSIETFIKDYKQCFVK